MNPPEIFAAGAVLWRPEAEGTKVALIHRPKYDDWTIPKGKVKKREHLLRTARREVFEETGIRPILGRRLSPSFYDKDGRPKRVDYWAATPAPNRQTATPAEGEVDQLEWLSIEDAAERLSYDRDLRVLNDFASGPIRTVPLILLRHAATGAGADWTEDDDTLRPLDDTGRQQAGALAKLLSCFGPATAIGSTSARCVETLLPYAIREDVSVTTDAAFTVGMAKPGQTEERLDELLACATPTIVCADDELLSELAELACDRLGAAAPTDTSLPEGGFRVLHIADGKLVTTEQHQCPVATVERLSEAVGTDGAGHANDRVESISSLYRPLSSLASWAPVIAELSALPITLPSLLSTALPLGRSAATSSPAGPVSNMPAPVIISNSSLSQGIRLIAVPVQLESYSPTVTGPLSQDSSPVDPAVSRFGW